MRILTCNEQETLLNALRMAGEECRISAARIQGPLHAMLMQSVAEYSRLRDLVEAAPAVALSEAPEDV